MALRIQGVYQPLRPFSKLLIFISLLLTGFGISTILGFVGAQLLFGVNVLSNPNALSDFSVSENINALKFMQFLHSTCLFVLPPVLYAYMTTSNWKYYLGLNNKPAIKEAALVLMLMVFLAPSVNLLVYLNESMNLPDWLHGMEIWMREKENTAEVITKAFLEMNSSGSYLLNVFIIGMIPAVGEELLFRGMIQGWLSKKWNHHIAIWLAAFLFSAMHLQFFGFFPRMILGALFGYLFYWSGSLWLPIIAHFINNAGAVTLQYIYGSARVENEIDPIGTESEDWFLLVVSLLSAVLTTIYLYKYRKQENIEKVEN